MKTTGLLNEIRDLNLGYLMLAQQMVREDRDAAMFRLGVSEEVADMIESLSPAQVLKMASANMMLCRLRFDDRVLLGLLSSHGRDASTSHLHATILAAVGLEHEGLSFRVDGRDERLTGIAGGARIVPGVLAG